MLATGNTAPYDLLTNMGSGASGMFETCMVAVLVAAMCALFYVELCRISEPFPLLSDLP